MNKFDNGYGDILFNLSKGLKEEAENQVQQSIEQGKKIDELFGTTATKNQRKDLTSNEKKEEINIQEKPMTVEEAMEKLNGLIGLENVKQKMLELVESLKGEKIIEEKSSLKVSKPNLHMIFAGPPGTGKTEVARILGNVLFALGFTKENKLIETDRSGLVAAFAGGTAEKVMNKFKEAEGGVLFIDEAYALANGDQFGKEAIDTVIKAMEDMRESVVVILAGYEAEMENLLRQNPGFKSRIPNKFDFKDYNREELTEIALTMLKSKGYDCDKVEEEIKNYIAVKSVNGVLEGNGRTIRNLTEALTLQHRIRIGKEEDLEKIKIEEITKEDVMNAITPKNNERKGMEELKEKAQKAMDELIEMDETKAEVIDFVNFSIVQSKKANAAKTKTIPSYNMIFKGPSGTGKSEMTKAVAQKLKAYEVLTNGQIKEVSRGDLIGAVIGETAQKVKNVLAQSVGGVLVIDRIESLDSDDSYSKEAVEVLIQEIDKYKGKISVILTGMEGSLDRFLEKNPVLLTKMNKTITFNPYSEESILEITKQKLKKDLNIELTEEEEKLILSRLVMIMPIQENGHWAEKFVEQVQIAQSNRIVLEESEEYDLYTKEDLEEAIYKI